MTMRHISRRLFTTTLAASLLLVTAASGVSASDGWSNIIESGDEVRDLAYPLAGGEGFYVDTWLFPRGSRRHIGVDIMAPKLTPVLAVNDGCVTYLDYGGPGGGNMLTLTDDDGWQYRYIHLNNDSPDTDDGANPYEWAFVGGLEEDDCVSRGDHISYVGDSGNAEYSGAHLHFEVRRADGNWINPFHSVEAAREALADEPDIDDTTPAPVPPANEDDQGTGEETTCEPQERTAPEATPDAATAEGYWLLDDQGRVHAVGVDHLGDLSDIEDAAAPSSMTPTPTGLGYWIVDADGVVHPFGDAEGFGDMSGWDLNGPVRRIVPTPLGHGYWLVADDGGVFTFGEAEYHGSTGAMSLRRPVISMSSTSAGDGYWLIASDGGVFTFGEAEYHGSTGAMDLDAPVIDMAVESTGSGYWLYAADGGVFSFGVDFHGSIPGLGRCDVAPATAMRPTPTGLGYWIATTDGEVISFGDAAIFEGSIELDEGANIIDLAMAIVPVAPEAEPDASTD
ncbi:MAG: M23 family metallopeptidase [Actinomycetia bacterium]|nr:M23 family metallopeptidase [Actinomycetes bacterium]